MNPNLSDKENIVILMRECGLTELEAKELIAIEKELSAGDVINSSSPPVKNT